MVVSCVLVAVMVTDPGAAGAVKSPLVLIVPALADQVTVELKAPVPWTVAPHCEVAFSPMVEGVHVAATEVIVGGGGGSCTVTEAFPDFVVSCTLVAVMVTAPAVAGAVKSPVELMEPAATDHVTAELKFPIP